jgi:hypothetical protein
MKKLNRYSDNLAAETVSAENWKTRSSATRIALINSLLKILDNPRLHNLVFRFNTKNSSAFPAPENQVSEVVLNLAKNEARTIQIALTSNIQQKFQFQCHQIQN